MTSFALTLILVAGPAFIAGVMCHSKASKAYRAAVRLFTGGER